MPHQTTPEHRTVILQKLSRLWDAHPDMRFGQFIYNTFISMKEVQKIRDGKDGLQIGIDSYALPDSVLMERLEEYLKGVKRE